MVNRSFKKTLLLFYFQVEKWIKRTLDKGIQALRDEFADLKRYTPPDMQIGTFAAHWDAGRNRYKDVPCQDKYRVILKWPGQAHDYVSFLNI